MSDEIRYRAGKRLWTAADDARMRREYPDRPSAELARELGRGLSGIYKRAELLGLRKSAAYLASPDACRLRRGDHVGAAFRFKPGQAPANKGLRRPGYGTPGMKATQFKAGHRGTRTMPIGATRLIDGYVYRKVSEIPKQPYYVNWKAEHVLLWTRAHGPVPAGHALAFRNGDRFDIRLENLVCLTRRELMARNSVHNLPAPLQQTVQLLGALTRQIRRRTHACEKQNQ